MRGCLRLRGAPHELEKRRFSYSERYAIWKCNGGRCWRCTEPLRLHETTVDHVLPEWLLYDHEERMHVISEYGLNQDFDISSHENWLPCHDRCNRKKGNVVPTFIPAHRATLENLIEQVPQTEKVAAALRSNSAKDRVFAGYLLTRGAALTLIA